jgi:hypothetical protein
MQEVQPLPSSFWPFRTQGEAGWLFPCGVILVTAAAMGYGWVIMDIVLQRPLLCDIETHHMFMLDLPMACGLGFLAAAVFERVSAKVLGFVVTTLVAGVGGALLLALLYSTQCTTFQMFLRQLVGLQQSHPVPYADSGRLGHRCPLSVDCDQFLTAALRAA